MYVIISQGMGVGVNWVRNLDLTYNSGDWCRLTKWLVAINLFCKLD